MYTLTLHPKAEPHGLAKTVENRVADVFGRGATFSIENVSRYGDELHVSVNVWYSKEEYWERLWVRAGGVPTVEVPEGWDSI